MSKPDITITAKSRKEGKTVELGAAWRATNKQGEPLVFEGKYGNRLPFNFSPGRNIKSIAIKVETNEGETLVFRPGKDGDAFISLMMDEPSGADDNEDF